MWNLTLFSSLQIKRELSETGPPVILYYSFSQPGMRILYVPTKPHWVWGSASADVPQHHPAANFAFTLPDIAGVI